MTITETIFKFQYGVKRTVMGKVTVKQIILSYLSVYKPDDIIPSHLIETGIPGFALSAYGIMVKPGSVSRIFRYMREDGEINIEFTDSTKKYFKIVEKQYDDIGEMNMAMSTN